MPSTADSFIADVAESLGGAEEPFPGTGTTLGTPQPPRGAQGLVWCAQRRLCPAKQLLLVGSAEQVWVFLWVFFFYFFKLKNETCLSMRSILNEAPETG